MPTENPPKLSAARIAVLACVALLTTGTFASAHPNHPGGTFIDGAAHPVSGIDHVLAMVAVGLLAARLGGRALWALPATFLTLMIAGGLLAGGRVSIPAVEQGIAASVLVLGLLLVVAARLPLPAAVALVGAFAMFHGYAHVAEMTGGGDVAAYAGGFVATTALLHGAGIAAAVAGNRFSRGAGTSAAVARLTGGAVAACGVLLLAGLL